MALDRFVFDHEDFHPWAVTDGCMRGNAFIHPHVLDDVVLYKVAEGGVIEFIGRAFTKK